MFPNPAPEGRTDTFQLSYIPQLLAEYIQYQNITANCWQNTRIYPIPIYIYIQLFIYSPIVGSIYPIKIYEIQFAAKKICGAQFATNKISGAQFAA